MIKILYLLSILFIYSCTVRIQTTERTLKVGLDNSKPTVSEIFSSIEIVPLETTENSLLRYYSKIIYKDDRFYVFDEQQSSVFIFDKNGRYLSQISKIGQGPGEYTAIYDFNINIVGGQVEIEMLSPFGNILCYDNNGNFLQKYDLPHPPPNYQKFEMLDSDKYILWSLTANDENSLSIFSKKRDASVNSFFKEEMVVNAASRNVFYSYNDTIFFYGPFSNKVYQVSDTGLKKAYEWDFGKEMPNMENLSTGDKNLNEDIESLRRKLENADIPFYYLKQAQTTDYYYALLCFSFKKYKHVFFRKDNGKAYVFEQLSEGMGFYPIAIYNDCIITSSLHTKKDFLAKNDLLSEADKQKLLILNEDDNPCLIKLNFRQ